MILTALKGPPVWTRWLVVAGWMAMIFVMSAQSNSGEQSGMLAKLVFQVVGATPTPEALLNVHHLMRKAAHFTEYGILAALMAWAQPKIDAHRARLTWAAAALYAASDEWHQSFVPHRGPAITDVVIDATGALTGLVLFMWVRGRRK